MRKKAFLIAAVALAGSVAATQQGDITSAIRDGANLSPTVQADRSPVQGTASQLFDGVLSRSGVPKPWAAQRYLLNASDLPLTLSYDVPDLFVPGESVVVTGITFAQGWSTADGSGGGYVAGNDKTPAYRMPRTWTLEGSNDGTTWSQIVAVDGLTTNDYSVAKYNDANDWCGQTFSFVNWKSFRQYHIVISGLTASTTYLQMSEIKLHGLYGGTVVQPAPERIDITAAVRAAGNLRTLDSNLEPWGTAYGLEKAFDGSCTSSGTDRYLASTNSTLEVLANGGAWISYEISDAFGRNADVIATGYTFDTQTGHGHAKARMPKAWKFQAHDGNAWVTLDSWDDFTMYDTVVVDSADQFAYTFNFTNNVPYRKYRFLITEQNTDNLAESLRAIQFSELRIWGYVSADIGGTSVGLTAEHPIDLTCVSTNGYFMPVLSCSQAAMAGNMSATNLFNGKRDDRLLVQLENDPLVVEYTIPDSFLPGRETLITNYAIMASTTFANYTDRMPRKWKLEGWCVDRVGNEGWRTIDSREDFAGYATDTSAKTCSASFDLSANVTNCRKYRFVFSEMQAPVNGNTQFQLAEIFLSGRWGQGISTPPDPPKGTIVIFK